MFLCQLLELASPLFQFTGLRQELFRRGSLPGLLEVIAHVLEDHHCLLEPAGSLPDPFARRLHDALQQHVLCKTMTCMAAEA